MQEEVDEELLDRSVRIGITQAQGPADDMVLFEAVKDRVRAFLIKPRVYKVIPLSFELDTRPISQRIPLEQQAVLLAANAYWYELHHPMFDFL